MPQQHQPLTVVRLQFEMCPSMAGPLCRDLLAVTPVLQNQAEMVKVSEFENPSLPSGRLTCGYKLHLSLFFIKAIAAIIPAITNMVFSIASAIDAQEGVIGVIA